MWTFLRFSALLVLFLMLQVACTSPPVDNKDAGPPPGALKKPTGCHPFAQGQCILPYPSTYYLVKDDKTPTGFRLSLPNKLPAAQKKNSEFKTPLKPELINHLDGFSAIAPILVLFPERVDSKTLITAKNMKRSLDKDSPIQLIEWKTHRRIPLFAEVDVQAKDGTQQVLMIRPMVRLKPGTRYAVVLMKSVKAVGGKELTPPPAFVHLMSGKKGRTPEELRMEPLLKETLEEVKAAGVDKGQILMTWDYWTGSDKPFLDRMLTVRKRFWELVDAKGPTYKIKITREFTEKENKHIWREIEGTFRVPLFMSQKDAGGLLNLDDKGLPYHKGEYAEYKFFAQIPRCALKATKPLPVLIFGHGIFGDAQGEMSSGYQRQLTNRLCVVEIGADWLGFSLQDSGSAILMTQDFNRIRFITERLVQGHVNFMGLARMALKRFPDDKNFAVKDRKLLDGKTIYYLGISNGAIQGGPFMALNTDIKRGVLNVGGGNWSIMLSRSGNFTPFLDFLRVYYTNPAELQILLMLSQHFWDYIDSVTWARYFNDPSKLGVPQKTILYQEALGDAQVPNYATRTFARTMGLPALAPLIEPVHGLELKKDQINGSAYTQWGPKPTPYPKDVNIPAKKNPAHEAIRRIESLMKQMESFFKPDGVVKQYCSGVCDPN